MKQSFCKECGRECKAFANLCSKCGKEKIKELKKREEEKIK